jgi:hypothetical protein
MTGFAPVQLPPTHVSVWVQALSSSHGVPSAFAGSEQMPVAGSHTPASWHCPEAMQTIGSEPTHTPAAQVSVWVHALPSSQAVPSSAIPVPVQMPPVQASVALQLSKSSHGVPSAFSGLEQMPVPESHTPASWH